MSHFTKVDTQIADIEALKKALEAMGLRLEHNIPCRYYYGQEVKENVAKLNGPYDVSFERDSNGTYNINADFWKGYVEQTIGPNGATLMRSYSIEKLKLETRKKGYNIQPSGANKFKIFNPTDSSGGYLEATLDQEGNFSFKAQGFSGSSCMQFDSLEKSLGATATRKTNDFYLEEDQTERLNLMEG